MRKWVSLILVSVFMYCSLLAHAENNPGNGVISDWYDDFERVFGNVTSIVQALENNDRYVAGVSYSPVFTIETEDYLLQVIEMWSDGNAILANVEL